MSEKAIQAAWNTLQAVYPILPKRESLQQETMDASNAQARGYYLPDEDERLRDVYLRYLSGRSMLWQMIHQLEPKLKEQDLPIFAITFCAASALVRSAGYLIEITKARPVVHQKLDEAEPRYGLPRKTFTKIYQSFTSPATAWRYRQARKFYEKHRTKIHDSLLTQGLPELIKFLDQESPFFITKKRTIWMTMMEYRLHSLTRRSQSGYHKVMFHLFRMSGSTIAGKRQPFKQPATPTGDKRVTQTVIHKMTDLLKPGDIIITRHDDALSNLFLPGFWPHAAFYVGTMEEREALGLARKGEADDTVLEAKKDGVKMRPLSETLTVDAFLVLRPKLTTTALAKILSRALTHEGKLYDFLFDFRKAERLACTEVVYRAFHGIDQWQLALVKQGGRLTLSAENLISQALANDLVDVVCVFGANDCRLTFESEAEEILTTTLNS